MEITLLLEHSDRSQLRAWLQENHSKGKECWTEFNRNITWIDTVDSTNEEARRQIQSLDHLSVISARHQTAGRGQRGNSWSSESGMNLTFSIVIKYGTERYGDLAPSDQFIISKITCLAVMEFLKNYGIDARIKWPNDIYVKDKKIAGILIENGLRGSRMAHSIIGIGLNVNQTIFESDLYNPTSIRLESQDTTDLDLHDTLEKFMNIFQDILENKTLLEVDRLYHSNLWRLDVKSTFVDNTTNIPSSPEFTGTIRGVSGIGELLIEDENTSEIRKFSFREIGYIL